MKTPTFWQSRGALSTLLLPASACYALGCWLDRTFTTAHRVAVPVISIGNATAGGAGKTPTTLALIPLLRSMGHVPHVLIRGYGGAALTAYRVSTDDRWQHVGDEALLLAKEAPTWVGRDRIASANAAIAAGATILLCDDALQHHALHKDVSILVVDGPYGFGNRRLIPAGPLREPLKHAIARSHCIIVIGDYTDPNPIPTTLPTVSARLEACHDVSTLREGKWFAFAGIGRPDKFFTSLRNLGVNLVKTRNFADHHAYSSAEIASLVDDADSIGARLVTTAKDMVRIPVEFQSNIAVLDTKLQFGETEALCALIPAAPAPRP